MEFTIVRGELGDEGSRYANFLLLGWIVPKVLGLFFPVRMRDLGVEMLFGKWSQGKYVKIIQIETPFLVAYPPYMLISLLEVGKCLMLADFKRKLTFSPLFRHPLFALNVLQLMPF